MSRVEEKEGMVEEREESCRTKDQGVERRKLWL